MVAAVLQHATAFAGQHGVLDEAGDLTVAAGPLGGFGTEPGTGVLVSVAPWFHVMGLVGYLNLSVLLGMTQVIHSRLDVPAFLADLSGFGATELGGAPALFAALGQRPDFHAGALPAIRVIYSGAAGMPAGIRALLAERFPAVPVCEAYGLTEATLGLAATPLHPYRPGSLAPLPGTELRIVDATVSTVDDATPTLPAGEPGEVCARGPQVMAGYLGRPAETAAVLGADGWLRTGDLGALDADGCLRIVDRAKDVLVYKGYNVYPFLLEERLLACPGVYDAAVVGRPDPAVGERAVAFVVAAPGTAPDALLAAVNADILPYHRLREVIVVDALPRSPVGKVLKRDLVARLTD